MRHAFAPAWMQQNLAREHLAQKFRSRGFAQGTVRSFCPVSLGSIATNNILQMVLTKTKVRTLLPALIYVEDAKSSTGRRTASPCPWESMNWDKTMSARR